MEMHGLEISGEIVSTEVKHILVGDPPLRFLALRLTHEDAAGARTTGPWQVLAEPLAQRFVEALQTSLGAPPPAASPTNPLH